MFRNIKLTIGGTDPETATTYMNIGKAYN